MTAQIPIQVYFSDVFWVPPATLEAYGAFDVSLLRDLPLFIDPFLLFNSEREEYQALHRDIIRYVAFLRDKAAAGRVGEGELRQWFMFPEVKQNWFGFSRDSNKGSGLGPEFAVALRDNLVAAFKDLGHETITRDSHLERVCLISDRVGRDNISDFTTNLIKGYLLEFTQTFALQHVAPERRRRVHVAKAHFNYDTETWVPAFYELPYLDESFPERDYVLLTPTDILTKEENWINKTDLVDDLPQVVQAVSDLELRTKLAGYMSRKLSEIQRRDEADREARRSERASERARSSRGRGGARREDAGPPPPTATQERETGRDTIRQFPEVIDYYIAYKEEHGDEAERQANERVRSSERLYIGQVRLLASALRAQTDFYDADGGTFDGARHRVRVLQELVEHGGAGRFLYADEEPIGTEPDLQILMRLTWLATPRGEDGAGHGGLMARPGPGRPRFDRAVIRFTLGSNPQILSALKKRPRPPILGEAPVLAIVCYSAGDRARVRAVLNDLELGEDPDIVIIATPRERGSREEAPLLDGGC